MDIRRSSVSIMILAVAILMMAPSMADAQIVVKKTSPSFSSVEVISPSLLKVSAVGGYGLVTLDGDTVAPCEYDEITPFAEQHCLLMKNGYVAAIADVEGNITILQNSLRVNAKCPYFSEGLLAVKNDQDRWGYVNYSGSIAIPCKYLKAFPFSCGLASVQWSDDGFFVHIDKTGHINFPKSGFTDPDVIFASSFVKDGDKEFALLYINGSFYKRNVQGIKDETFQLRGHVNSFSKELVIGRCIFKFDEAWRPFEMIYGANTIRYSPEPLVDDSFVSKSLVSVENSKNGEFSLKYAGNYFCSVFCEDVKPLQGEYCAARINGLWEIAQVLPGESLSIVLDDSAHELNHPGPINFTGTVSLPSVLEESSVDLMVSTAGSEYFSVPVVDGKASISYSPSVLQQGNDLDLSLYCKSGIVRYPVMDIPVSFSYKNALELETQSVISLDSNGSARISISVKNNSSQPSGRVDVIVSGTNIGSVGPIPPFGTGTLAFVKSIDVGDEDSVTRQFSIELCEEGCPSTQQARSITFERYYVK